MSDHRRHVTDLHPSFSLPSQELDVLGVEMRAARHRGRAVVLLHPLVDDEAALAEVARHRRPRVGRRVLNVRPVDVLARESEVGRDGLARIVGIADDKSADDEHAVAMEDVDRVVDRIAVRRPSRARLFFALAFRNARSSSRMFSMPRNTYLKPASPHQRRQLVAVRGDRRRHPLHHVVDIVEPGVDDRLAQRLEPRRRPA